MEWLLAILDRHWLELTSIDAGVIPSEHSSGDLLSQKEHGHDGKDISWNSAVL